MIDPIVKLAVSMRARRGTFALLLGSGISRSASIPTGWDIVQRLATDIAVGLGEVAPSDPIEWYRGKFGKEPDYSELLEELGQTPAERSLIIKGYIEPTDEERGQGLKLPTDAHQAIAELVASRYIRVIVTTNFDRLLELALTELGITPSVIDSADDLREVIPLAHNDCTIIKVNGDYVDVGSRTRLASSASTTPVSKSSSSRSSASTA